MRQRLSFGSRGCGKVFRWSDIAWLCGQKSWKKVVWTACQRMEASVSVTVAEAYAIRRGLQLAQELKLDRILLHSDALNVINCIHGLCALEEINLVVGDCCSLVGSFKDVAILFVGRKNVFDAHNLVGIGYVVGFRNWNGFLPSFVIDCNVFSVSGA